MMTQSYSFSNQINPLFHSLSNEFGKQGRFITITYPTDDPTWKRAKKKRFKFVNQFLKLLKARMFQECLWSQLQSGAKLKSIADPTMCALAGTCDRASHIGLWANAPRLTNELIKQVLHDTTKKSRFKRRLTKTEKMMRLAHRNGLLSTAPNERAPSIGIKIEAINTDYSFVGDYITRKHWIKPIRTWAGNPTNSIKKINKAIHTELSRQGRAQALAFKAAASSNHKPL